MYYITVELLTRKIYTRTHAYTHSHTIIVRFRYGQAFVLNVQINCCVNDTTPMVYTDLGYGVVAVVVEPAWIRIPPTNEKCEQTKNNNHENAYRKQLCTHLPIFLLTFNYFAVWILYSLSWILFSLFCCLGKSFTCNVLHCICNVLVLKLTRFVYLVESKWSEWMALNKSVFHSLHGFFFGWLFSTFQSTLCTKHNDVVLAQNIHKSVLFIIQIHTLERIIVTSEAPFFQFIILADKI